MKGLRMFKKSVFTNQIINVIVLTATVIYALVMIKLLFLRGNFHYRDSYNYNLIPFKTINLYIFNREHYNPDIWIKNLFGNIVMFIPLGLSIPVLNKKYMKLLPFFIFVLSILLTVELVQLFTRVGSFDIDDLILNTLGAFLGFALTKLSIRVFTRERID